MFERILSVVAAAACAAVIVGFIPPPAPAVAADTLQAVPSHPTSISDSSSPAIGAEVRVPEIRKTGCTQAWPYYEPSCLHDSQQSDSKARVVRVVTADRAVVGRTSQAPR
jgi:hypothetical protein